MKIQTKIFLSLASILGLLLAETGIVASATDRVESVRRHFLNSQARVIAVTGLRGEVRNQVLNTFEVLLIEGIRGHEGKLSQGEKTITTQIEKYDHAIRSDPSTDSSDLGRFNQLENIRITARSLNEALKSAAAYADQGKTRDMKSVLLMAHNSLFLEKFLPAVMLMIDAEKESARVGSDQLAAGVKRLRTLLFLFSTLAVLIALGVAIFIARSVGARLNQLRLATRDISRGQFNTQVLMDGKDEVADLSHAFNQMAASLLSAQDQVFHQQQVILTTSKLSALGEMAGGIAHEINNPLAIIQMRSELLKEGVESGEYTTAEIIQSAELIYNTSARIAKIIRGLRTFSRDGKDDVFQLASIQNIVGETLSFCREKIIHEGIRLEVDAPEAPIWIQCRATQISQVILNLINNAYEAVQSSSERWIRIEIRESGTEIELSVNDSGPGVPSALHDRIMEPFFTTKEIGKGTGLGLSISQGIIQAHRGQLKVDAISPHTRFLVILPKFQSGLR